MESGTYTTNFSTSSVFGLNDQLKHVNVTTLTHSGLSGFTFQPGTSPYFSYGLFLTSSHQCPVLSVSINSHACSQNFIHQQDVTFCPVLTQWPSSPTLSPVLVQSQVVSPSVVVGYTNPVGCGLPHLPSLVSQTKCDDRRSVTSSGTQPVLLYGCIPDGMERQLERPSDIRTNAAPESQHHIHWLEPEAIRLALLHWWLQWLSQSVRVYCENSTAAAYIRKQGGTHSQSLFYKTQELFDLLDQFVIILQKIQKLLGNHGHLDCVTTSIQAVAPASSTVEHTSSNSSPGRQPVPVLCPTSDAPKFHPDPRLLDLATWKLSGTSWKAIIPRHCRQYGCETPPEFLR